MVMAHTIGRIFFMKKYEKPLMKVFILVSIAFLLYYLAGVNVSAYKQRFHCIRYVTSIGLLAKIFYET